MSALFCSSKASALHLGEMVGAEGRCDDVLVLDCLRGIQAFWRVEEGASRPLMMDGSALR